MVAGLRALGLIDAISRSVSDFENAKAGLMLAFSAITGLITFISGSGNAAFYSFIEIIPQIAEKQGWTQSWLLFRCNVCPTCSVLCRRLPL